MLGCGSQVLGGKHRAAAHLHGLPGLRPAMPKGTNGEACVAGEGIAMSDKSDSFAATAARKSRS